jgi:iron complex outermembrane recepter protein
VLLSTQVNGGEAKVYGVETAYSQVFDFLPAPLDGLGMQASYTHTSVESSYTAGARPIVDQLISTDGISGRTE